jgi:hypothetical protein
MKGEEVEMDKEGVVEKVKEIAVEEDKVEEEW